MRYAVFTEVAATRFLDERQCPLPHSTQFRQHLFLLVDHLDVRRYRRLAPDHACFDDYHRNVKPLKKGTTFGGSCRSLLVRLRMALSIALRWPINSPADQRPSEGLVFHWSAGTVSAARRSSLCARARFSMMVATDGTVSSIPAERAQTAAPPACSKAWASWRTRASPKAAPKICRPTGSFPSILPQGTEIPGTPASDPVTVYISARYIWSGSSVRSPNLNGGTGEVGVRIASTLVNASRKSWAISERTFCPFK